MKWVTEKKLYMCYLATLKEAFKKVLFRDSARGRVLMHMPYHHAQEKVTLR